VKWIGVEKGDHVKASQVLVELEDDEFMAQLDEARGQVEAARAYLRELHSGFLPQEIEQARNDLEEVRATTRNDKLSLDRTRYSRASRGSRSAATR
jgi:multidrug efflux pump subunit AcrA (membrane-fusion protein)